MNSSSLRYIIENKKGLYNILKFIKEKNLSKEYDIYLERIEHLKLKNFKEKLIYFIPEAKII